MYTTPLWLRLAFAWVMCCLLSWPHAMAATDFLAPSDAFQASLRQPAGPDGPPTLHFQIAPGYHLYRDRLELSDGEGRAVAAALPSGREKFDANFGQFNDLEPGHYPEHLYG